MAANEQTRGAVELVDALRRCGWTLACAESLTGGLVAAAIVDVPGASDVFRGGVVAYATDLKAAVLGVSSGQLEQTGPVDREVALQMARGARSVLAADCGVATTGVAGPGPADGHEAGTVWIAVSGPRREFARELHLPGGRSEVRSETVRAAIELVMETL